MHGEALAFALLKQAGDVVGSMMSDRWGDFSDDVRGHGHIPRFPSGQAGALRPGAAASHSSE